MDPEHASAQGDDGCWVYNASEIQDEILRVTIGNTGAIRHIARQVGGVSGGPVRAVARRKPLLVAEVVIKLNVHLVANSAIHPLGKKIVDVGEGIARGSRQWVIRENVLRNRALQR